MLHHVQLPTIQICLLLRRFRLNDVEDSIFYLILYFFCCVHSILWSISLANSVKDGLVLVAIGTNGRTEKKNKIGILWLKNDRYVASFFRRFFARVVNIYFCNRVRKGWALLGDGVRRGGAVFFFSYTLYRVRQCLKKWSIVIGNRSRFIE